MSARGNGAAARAPLPQTEAPLARAPESSFAFLELSAIEESAGNPRRHVDKAAFAELADSVRRQGILQPVLVRPLPGRGASIEGRYELIAGHRRFAAAKAVGLASIPATIRELTDVEALEVQLLENLQREGLTPLEEADGYQRLAKAPGYDVARVAEKVGRSVKYVYDRMRLLALTKDVRALLAAGEITAGHAILLARLSGADQARALQDGALFANEPYLFDPADGESKARRKAVSVRELNAWIDKNVRMDPGQVDPMLFPEAALKVESAPKVVAITHLHYVPEEAREGKTYFPQSWRRADGREGSKGCPHATLGFVAVGPHRGEAFEVCIAKDQCTTHWASEIRDRKKRTAARAAAPAAPAKKAESPETAARKAALEKALDAARKAAIEEASEQLGKAAAALTPEQFIRRLADVFDRDLPDALREMGETVKGVKDVEAWVKRAPLPQVQRVVARSQMVFYDQHLFESFGIDCEAIEQRHEREAREKFKAAQTSAKPAKAPGPKPGRKAKG